MGLNGISLGKQIACYRKSMKLTQDELADKIGVSRTHLSNIEIGKSVPSLDVLIEISNVFHVGIDRLLVDSLQVSRKRETDSVILEIMRKCTYEERKVVERIVSELVSYFYKEK